MRRRRAPSNSPASLLRRFGSSTVARFVLIRSLSGGRTFFPFVRPFFRLLPAYFRTSQALFRLSGPFSGSAKLYHFPRCSFQKLSSSASLSNNQPPRPPLPTPP